MKFEDIRKAITSKQKDLGSFYYENINKIKRPCFYIEVVDYKKEFYAEHKEHKSLTLDILCFPSDPLGSKAEVIDMMERLDEAFEIQDVHGYKRGMKILHVIPEAENKGKDRYLTLINNDMHIVDEVGHYKFDIELYDTYGKPYDYELMNDLDLKFKVKE